MKTALILFTLAFATAASAQQGGMTPEMQQMMQAMQKNMGQIQQCMAQIDHQALQSLQVRAEKMESEVKQLCAVGKRDAAQEKALKFGLEISQDPELQKMRKCGEGIQGMPIPGELLSKAGTDAVATHICDN